MARIFIDGFESGGADLWDSLSGSVVAARTGHSGSYCLNLSSLTNYIQRAVPADDEYYFAFKYEPVGGDSTSLSVLALYAGSTLLVQVRRLATTGYLAAYRGTTKIAEAASKPVLVSGGIRLIEIRVKIHDTEGLAQVKVDGEMVIDFSGDTKPGTDTQIKLLRLGYAETNYYGNAYYDDFIIDDADWIGNTKIQAILPNAAGNATHWDPSAGDNYACVDERPASDTDYVSTNTADEIDLYAASNLSGSIGSVKCVQLQARCAYEGSPTPTHLQLGLRSGGANYFSANKTPPASFGQSVYALWDTNPADSEAWEGADVNALEIGFKATA